MIENLRDKNFFVNQKFEELSRNYYEEILYPQFIEEHKDDTLEKAFEKYLNNGFTVHLRQILNYEFLNHNNDYRAVLKVTISRAIRMLPLRLSFLAPLMVKKIMKQNSIFSVQTIKKLL